MNLRKILFALLLLDLCSVAAHSQEKLRVLFIGNSLTYSNDIPAIIASIAESTKQKRLDYKTIARPDFSLEDHWNQGDARKEISKGQWDFVVLQQGPSALPESRLLLREYVRKFSDEIERVRARPAIYMVWPAVSRKQDFDRVVESHELAASDVGALLLPVGAAWREALRKSTQLPLYSADNFHSSRLGSYLAAWVIFKCLYGNPTVSLPERVRFGSKSSMTIMLNADEVALLQEATSRALK
jgi:hypothetical protein